MAYCSLADARAEIKAQGTIDDAKLIRYIRQVGARLNAIMEPRTRKAIFEPYIEERAFLLRPQSIASAINAFYFHSPLLSLSSVRVNSIDVTSSVEIYPNDGSTVRAIRFIDGQHHWYEFNNGRNPSYVYVTGEWGIRADYAHAWIAYDTVQTNPVTPGATSFLVSDTNGDDPFGIAPRFSAGQLLRIGTGTEIMRTASADDATNAITVQRAQNGSSLPASDYAVGSTVYVFEPEEQIRRVVARQAALMYARMGAFQVETLDGVGVVTYPQDLLIELQNVLTEYQYI